MDIYVGNLSFNLSEDELQGIFSEYGEVKSVKIVTDKLTGRSKGFGFVTMDNSEEADNAVNQLNGKEVGGRNIVVNQARPKTEGQTSGGGGGNRGGGFRGNNNRSGGGGGNRGGGGYRDRDSGGGGGYRDSDNNRNRW